MIAGNISYAGEMQHIRPYQVLKIVDDFPDEIKFFMPQAQGVGSVSTIESVLLLKLMRVVNPDYLFEFGTYKGLTTRLLLENLPVKNIDAERIYTLDLPDINDVQFQGDDINVAIESIASHRKYLNCANKHLVKQILQNSMTLDIEPYENKFQFIFIDGNHEVSYVTKDTENALAMLSGQAACIVWHDYGNAQFPELTEYLNDLSKKIQLYHIEDTMLVFYLQGHDVSSR
ncbi:class I SAM-dependent methyltransferase [Neisseriaceae bacterium TC5R-5]|nr:class I SAM-dependent methyltransferase [Neisseriaceae bacterium TC5R-5]